MALTLTQSRFLDPLLSQSLSTVVDSEYKISNLLNLGLDPSLSRLDQACLHNMVIEGPDSVVRALVMNGFLPLDIVCHRLLKYFQYMWPLPSEKS